MNKKTWRRAGRYGLWGALGLLGLTALAVWWGLRSSLAQLEGEVPATGLTARLVVSRDADGVPLIAAGDRNDGAYALGYLHAQERYFQMDLLRRAAAGELAALLGANLLEMDKGNRLFRFRARAQAALKRLDPSDYAMLTRYVAGVNDGLGRLGARPFEYLLLRAQPEAWRAEDTLLVTYAMYQTLQNKQEQRKHARNWLQLHATPEQLAVLLPQSSQFDAPLDMQAIPPSDAPLPASAPAWFGFAAPAESSLAAAPDSRHTSVGSNSWALAGSRTKHGGAILANDMHLALRLPNTWYRATLRYPVAGTSRQLTGLTLPGAPNFVVGSNGKVAWGFTNSYGDYLDLVELGHDPAQPGRFSSGEGWEVATTYQEPIAVKGQPTVPFSVQETRFGPVRTVNGRHYAVHWVALHPDAVNLRLTAMESVQDISEAAGAAARAGIPAQNISLVDASGQIGWTIAGAIPQRAAGKSAIWSGLLPAAEYPQWRKPASGTIWTANNRQLGGEAYGRLNDGGADLGARARQIRDHLQSLTQADEQAAYQIFLDDRADFAAIWREQALRALTDAAVSQHPQRAEFRRLLQTGWTGKADVGATGYRLARAYMHCLYEQLFGKVDEELARLPGRPDFNRASLRWPAVILRLLKERPAGWLPAGRTWDGVELAAIDDAIRQLTDGGQSLGDAAWGKLNTAAIAHPLASALPGLGRWLAAPATPLSGDDHMPLVSAPDFGQSERLVVSPGREDQALFNMPGGQSGHPLSPFFLADHRAWVEGRPRPLLPQQERYRLTFVPK